MIERARLSGAIDSVQSTWNLLERSAGEALAAAHNAGLTVIVKEGLANGRLTGRGDVAALADAARERGLTPDALALAAALAQPWSDVVLSGASTVLYDRHTRQYCELSTGWARRLGAEFS